MEPTLVISRLGLKQDALKDQTVIVTGAGGGIGYEASRALLWLGANVVIAEVNEVTGAAAAEKLGKEFPSDRISFIRTDVGDPLSVEALRAEAIRRFGKVDAVINNATIAVLGMVKDVPIEKWDASYKVNLRGPVLMARTFLPGMIERKHGVFACVSSTGTAYLGGYETFKAAQVHLANTLDAELEGTGVIAYTIGPGLVPTETAASAVKELAPVLGMTLDEFYALNQNALLTPEEAGAGFAVSILFAERFKGTEISSIQALKAADINFGSSSLPAENSERKPGQSEAALGQVKQVRLTLKEQSDGWKKRSIFERQWVLRDFRKTSGMSAEEWLDALDGLQAGLENGSLPPLPELDRLAAYYDHLAELAKGFEKNPQKLEENLRYVYGWRDEVRQLIEYLG